AVARTLRMPLLVIDGDGVHDANWKHAFLHAQRQAFLDSAMLAWTGEAASRRQWPSSQALFPAQFILCQPEWEPPATAMAVDRRVRLPMPEARTRAQLWRQSIR